MSKKYAAMLVMAGLLLPSAAQAHGASHGGGASALASGQSTFTVTTSWVAGRRFTDAELVDFASRHVHAHSVDNVMVSTLSISHGITENLTFAFALPHIYKGNARAGHHAHGGGGPMNTVDNHGSSMGRGDAVLQAHYRFFNHHGTEATASFGLKMPTGQTKNTSDEGGTLEPEFQPGSGAWDPSAGLALRRRAGALIVDASIAYTVATEGAQGVNLGDHAAVSFGVARRSGGQTETHTRKDGSSFTHTHAAWDYGLKLEGNWMARMKSGNVVDKNSGGTEIFIGPTLVYTAETGWSAQGEIGVPLVRNLRAGHAGMALKTVFSVSHGF